LGVGRSAGIPNTSLISLTSEERRGGHTSRNASSAGAGAKAAAQIAKEDRKQQRGAEAESSRKLTLSS
jgi:hypothetical protein